MQFVFETSGALKLPSAEEMAEADEGTAIIAYTYGTTDDGHPYYAYTAVSPSKYKEFHAMTATGESMCLGDYGTVIASGFESSPPDEVFNQLRELYGIDHDYEKKLEQEAKKQQAIFLKNQEDKRVLEALAFLKQKPGNA